MSPVDSLASDGLLALALTDKAGDEVLDQAMQLARAVLPTISVAYYLLRGLKELGISLSVDDFGTGYSSLSYLKRSPVDVLKIDSTFVDTLGVDRDGHAIVRAIIALAQSLGMAVVAEGIETSVQLQALRSLGCSMGQGYLLGRPSTAEDITRLLALVGKPSVPAARLAPDGLANPRTLG